MKVAAFVASMLAKVAKFNQDITGIKAPERPRVPRKERVRWAATALREEVDEFVDACERGDVAGAADALVDMVYFALGRLHEMGVPSAAAVFDEVHAANMKKVRGEQAKRPGSLGHDAVKPAGWTPPDHSWLNREDLRQALAGWDSLSPVLKRITELRMLKGQDYNQGPALKDYFPFGDESYIQMIHVKATRLRSLLAVVRSGAKPNFEGMRDSVDDLINYTTFYGEWLMEQEAKSKPRVIGEGYIGSIRVQVVDSDVPLDGKKGGS